MPRAPEMPPIRSEVHPVPTKTNLLGVKGGAEAGNAGAPPAIIHAILDALAPWRVTDLPLPATPERIWRAIHKKEIGNTDPPRIEGNLGKPRAPPRRGGAVLCQQLDSDQLFLPGRGDG